MAEVHVATGEGMEMALAGALLVYARFWRGPGRRGPRRRGEDGRGGGFAERLFPVDAFRRDHSASLR